MFDTGGSPAERREQRDFILRVIKQVVRAVAECGKLRESSRHGEALADLHEAYRSLLDVDPAVLHLLGRKALVQIYRDRGQLEPLALLIGEEARLQRERGDPALAARLRRRCEALLAAARRIGPLSREGEAQWRETQT